MRYRISKRGVPFAAKRRTKEFSVLSGFAQSFPLFSVGNTFRRRVEDLVPAGVHSAIPTRSQRSQLSSHERQLRFLVLAPTTSRDLTIIRNQAFVGGLQKDLRYSRALRHRRLAHNVFCACMHREVLGSKREALIATARLTGVIIKGLLETPASPSQGTPT